jgi:hypothetical protein
MRNDPIRAKPVTSFMAECFWPGVTEQHLTEAGTRARQAADAINSHGVLVRHTGSILVPADEIAFCLFDAASIDAVSDLNRRAAVPFERILEIVHLGPWRRSGLAPDVLDDPTTSAKELR